MRKGSSSSLNSLKWLLELIPFQGVFIASTSFCNTTSTGLERTYS
ncbi:hypothetical protein AVDCRST_MAG94-4962 [uncultured Leptolyngbya sp.]|uniref:Uncharacterized protein n=1 Tax=uncultured Leptolyngbya sp. TaxID=332963 RepID=A0A6J4NE50_9CYAN|nr:hypothetical protein AVDCRST_MAG94-4962 [uncultured Leptolyngbya sp.]